MPSLNLHGEIFNLPSDAFLTGIVGILLSRFDVVGNVYWSQQVGQSITTKRGYLPILESCLSLIKDNLDIIEDQIIRECSQRIHVALTGFIEAGKDLVVWESVYVTSYARRKHKRLTLDVGSFEISPWVAHPEYQARLKLINRSVSLYFEALVILVSHIEPMVADTHYEPLINQIARFKQQIPDYRLNLKVGFQEYMRIKASELPQ